MKSTRPALCLLAGVISLPLLGLAAVPTPPANQPRPDKYKATLRYDIVAPRDQHVALYKAMIGHLDKIGFEFQPKLEPFPNTDYEDPRKNILTGFLAPDKALGCLNNRSVASLLLVPPNYEVPADPAQPVHVRLELASGFTSSRQLALANQVRALLGLLGFQESVGYDHRGLTGRPFTRIVGTIPADQLTTLLKDLRTQPSGWLAPQLETERLPAPLSQVAPIIVTEVLPEPAPASDAPRPAPRGQDYLDKISPDLWAMVIGKDDDTKVVRAEIILSFVPAADDETYQAILANAAPGLVIEGRLGPVVSGLLRVNQASSLAGLPEVSVVRLAKPALVQLRSQAAAPGDNTQALKLSGLEELHQRGFKGQGVRIAIVDSDFRGFKELVQNGKLPKATRLLDLTAEFNPDLLPDPELADDKTIGQGTQCALAASLAAPEAELTLIRIDPASPLQMQLVGKAVNGEPILDSSLTRRANDLRAAAQELRSRQEQFVQERQSFRDNFEDDYDLKRTYEILGPVVRGWLFTPREWIYHRLLELERDGELQRQLEARFHRLFGDLQKLKGTQIVSTSLMWEDGYPLGGASPLSKWFDDNQRHKALWFVSAGNTRGQSWTAAYRDSDHNGVMEFAAPEVSLPPGTWTRELNFLAWQPHESERSYELPEGANVRISMQWQEPHDPSFYWSPSDRDRYLKPLADVSLVVLRQRDPTGQTLPVDEFEVAARSPVPAFRIDNHPTGSTYEQVVEFTVPKTGRFALRVESRLPPRWELKVDPASGRPTLVEVTLQATTGIRPADAASLPAVETKWEMRPRIFVAVTDPPIAAKGRVVFRDFWTPAGSIPLLADTRSLISVGAAKFSGDSQPYSAFGSPGTLWNVAKPNILAYADFALTPAGTSSAYGTSLATPFAAGTAAALLSAGVPPHQLASQLLHRRGAVWCPPK
jgi:hypothetical protein